ncbi:MAG: transposase [Sedimenticolaceae bacterium]|jgi:hypothetical protein
MHEYRLAALMNKLTDHTVFADLIKPVERVLNKIRLGYADGRVLPMRDFVALGVLRHLKGMHTLREQVQALLHLDPGEPDRPPLARSTWSDALSATSRRTAMQALVPELVAAAKAVLPDRLADLPGLGQRPVRAIDGTYQRESAHYRRCTPKDGGTDNPKGHALLSFYNLRLGIPEDAYIDTRNRHESLMLRDYDREASALTRQRNTLWLVDRAFIDGRFWDQKKVQLSQTMITRMKSNLLYEILQARVIDHDNPVNAGIVFDQQIQLNSAEQPWRRICLVSRRGRSVEFLTNELELEPGVIAFLYSRRWEEEKCFDTWKNDFSQAKAWGKSLTAIENQVLLAIVTSILIVMRLHQVLGDEPPRDEKALRKQDKRQAARYRDPDGTDRPDWATPLYRYTTKLSRQVLRFFQNCFDKIASPGLYQRQLRPMLVAYL